MVIVTWIFVITLQLLYALNPTSQKGCVYQIQNQPRTRQVYSRVIGNSVVSEKQQCTFQYVFLHGETANAVGFCDIAAVQ